MTGRATRVIAVDPNTGKVTRCPGPDERGACRRVAIGQQVPCIGRALVIVGLSDDPYVVPPQMTLCPLTLAAGLGVTMGRTHEETVVPAA